MNPRKRVSSQTPAVMQTSTHQCRSVWGRRKKSSNDLKPFAERYVRGRLFSFFNPRVHTAETLCRKRAQCTASTQDIRPSRVEQPGGIVRSRDDGKYLAETDTGPVAKLATHSHVQRVLVISNLCNVQDFP